MLVISLGWWDEADKTQHAAGVSLWDFLSVLQGRAWLPPSPVSPVALWRWLSPCLGLAFHSAGVGKSKGRECLRFERSPHKLKPFISP